MAGKKAQQDFKPWHRQEDETQEQWELFELWMQHRSVTRVAEAYFKESNADGGRVYVQRIKTQKRWAQRSEAFDRWVARNRDQAISEMITSEIAVIKRQRLALLRDLHKKVRRVGKLMDAKSNEDFTVYQVDMYGSLAQRLDNLWRKVEESNPAASTEEKPFEQEISNGRQSILEAMEKIRRTVPPELNPPSETGSAPPEILQ